MRYWREFDPIGLGSEVQVTCYGIPRYLRAGMLCFAESIVYIESAETRYGRGAVLCRSDIAQAVRAKGHEPWISQDPRREFWEAFLSRAHSVGPGEVRVATSAVIESTAKLGGDAFKIWDRKIVPSLGGVRIASGASVGAGTCIDAGIYGEDTEIGEDVHIDNLVHVGHSARIGAGAKLVAGAMIGGWADIGAGAWIGLGAMVRDGVKVGVNAFVGMGAVVVKDVPPHTTVVGNPARVMR